MAALPAVPPSQSADADPLETKEWIDALDGDALHADNDPRSPPDRDADEPLDDDGFAPDILDPYVRAHASVNNCEGVGVTEAPRGTLIHHYKVDRDGLITWANLIIATGHNNAAMNRGVLQVARHFVHGNKLTEGMLNRVEAVIRAFDPCLSCSTHADGRLALEVELLTGKRLPRAETSDSTS